VEAVTGNNEVENPTINEAHTAITENIRFREVKKEDKSSRSTSE